MKILCLSVAVLSSLASSAFSQSLEKDTSSFSTLNNKVGGEDRLAPSLSPYATSDPPKIIYRLSGVRDNGGAVNTGTATTFHCSSFSTVTEKIWFRLENWNGSVLGIFSYNVLPRRTFTASTHGTNLFSEDAALTPGISINQGMAIIMSTTTNIHCSAMIVEASVAYPLSVSLHLARMNPHPGTTE